MARRQFTLSVTACVLLLVPVVVPALFVLRISPAADQVGAQELGPKQAYLSGTRSAEAPLSSANQAATNQSAKPSGKMSFIPASPSPRDNAPKSPRAVANPVVRREVKQPPKYAVAAGAAPDASRSPNGDARSVASRPGKPQPSAVASKTPLRAPASRQGDRPQQPPEILESPAETLEPVVVANGKQPTRTLEEPLPEKGPASSVVQLFFEDESPDEDPSEMMDVDEPLDPIRQRDEIRTVAAQDDSAKAQNAVDPMESERRKRELKKRVLLTEALMELKSVRKIELADVVNPPKKDSDKDKQKVSELDEITVLEMRLADLEKNEMTALAMRLTDLDKDESER